MMAARPLIAAAVTVGLLAPTPSASADEVCLHRVDFRTVEASSLTDNPMSRYQAHRLFGFDGRSLDDFTRVYRGCGDDSRAWLQFEPDAAGIFRVVSSAFTWRYFGDGLITLQPA